MYGFGKVCTERESKGKRHFFQDPLDLFFGKKYTVSIPRGGIGGPMEKTRTHARRFAPSGTGVGTSGRGEAHDRGGQGLQRSAHPAFGGAGGTCKRGQGDPQRPYRPLRGACGARKRRGEHPPFEGSHRQSVMKERGVGTGIFLAVLAAAFYSVSVPLSKVLARLYAFHTDGGLFVSRGRGGDAAFWPRCAG